MSAVGDTLSSDDYDEFALLAENASEWDLPFDPARVHPPGSDGT